MSDIDAGLLASLRELGATVWSNRHHNISRGTAHDEVRAARAAQIARRSGMDDPTIAAAMGLSVDDVRLWLGPSSDPVAAQPQ